MVPWGPLEGGVTNHCCTKFLTLTMQPHIRFWPVLVLLSLSSNFFRLHFPSLLGKHHCWWKFEDIWTATLFSGIPDSNRGLQTNCLQDYNKGEQLSFQKESRRMSTWSTQNYNFGTFTLLHGKFLISVFSWQIERLQNVHLRRAYEVQKKHISDKNKRYGGAGEKLLYHGTTQENCHSIMKTGFNRSFAGQNGKNLLKLLKLRSSCCFSNTCRAPLWKDKRNQRLSSPEKGAY